MDQRKTSTANGGNGRARKTTIYDLARAVDASPATVSMVLNDKWRANRISPDTAARILAAAQKADYSVNRSARGLRLARSGLAGMVIPQYQNRFFAEMSEAFEAEARQRGLCPIVVSSQRDPGTELEVVETLLAHQVESLFLAGVQNPAPLNTLAHGAGVRCINIDLPGSSAPSVVTDNRGGARMLAARLLDGLAPTTGAGGADQVFFIGGVDDDATQERIIGFREAFADAGREERMGRIEICGYLPDETERCAAVLYRELGQLPAGVFVNSITAFEGVVRSFQALPAASLRDRAIGCFDWNPFASFLPFPVVMVAQDTSQMMAEAFGLIDHAPEDNAVLVSVAPRLVETATAARGADQS